jgi:hypothetical protein
MESQVIAYHGNQLFFCDQPLELVKAFGTIVERLFYKKV